MDYSDQTPPETRVNKAKGWIKSAWAQYQRKLANPDSYRDGMLTSFGDFAQGMIDRDRSFREKNLRDPAATPAAQAMHLDALRDLEVNQAALNGLPEHINKPGRVNTAYIGEPANTNEMMLAAQGYKTNRNGVREELSSRRIATKLAQTPTPAAQPAATGLLTAASPAMPAAAPQVPAARTPAAQNDPNREKINHIAQQAYEQVERMKARGLGQQEIIDAMRTERDSIGADLRAGRAQVNTDIVGALRQAELGEFIAANHFHRPQDARHARGVTRILNGQKPDLNEPSKSGFLEAGLPKAETAAGWKQTGIQAKPAAQAMRM